MGIAFSKRTNWDVMETALAKALRELQHSGRPVLDLTASNPTHCGFAYNAGSLLAPLANPAALDYDPNPRGMLTAREAVCKYYSAHQASLEPQQIFLTTGTSEAYSWVFRLLCDGGDEVLIAQPSYPLFDFLAVLDDVRLIPYPLIYDHGWQMDEESLRQRITPRTRAIALVNPNNPTGHFTKPWEREMLERLCREHGLALIVDEVFLDYGLDRSAVAHSFAQGPSPVLTFVLSGLSKVAGLPQMKAAWIACLGPEPERHLAQDRLEIIADTFLSMNAPVQHALPDWLDTSDRIQEQIRRRVAENLGVLHELLETQTLVSQLVIEGGWYAVLRIPAIRPDEETAIALLAEGISLHPGYFFGFPESGWLVVSLLTIPADFFQGIHGLLQLVKKESKK
ncbi:MAG TPA: pyridoxal phosphate-dependent aminotransferase [Acidisarcina sp.]|nr:pyridoxal phosphate-dependent aminotransferase [Acidisarcina sp.]